MNAWIVFKKEILSFFRDKNTIIYSIVLPIALYPLIFWFMNQVMTLHEGSLSEMPARVAFTERPPDELVYIMLESGSDFDIRESRVPVGDTVQPDLRGMNLDVLMDLELDAADPVVQIYFDSSSDRSNEARDRMEGIMDEFKMHLLGSGVDLALEELPVIETIRVDLASDESRSRFLLGILLPMIIVIITVMGGLYPSIEVITSERERKTLETTLVSPVSENGLIIGKFAAVIAMSTLAGILNIFAMILTLRHTLFSGMMTDFQFSIPWNSIPLIFFGIVLVGATFSALMILVAAFAKDFKEAQSFVSPIYALGIQPAVVAAIPGVPFNTVTALIPVTNISLLFRALIQNKLELVPVAITLGSLLLWCALLLAIARRLLRRDAVVMGLNKSQLKTLLRGKSNAEGVR